MSVLGQKRDPAKATKKREPYVLPDEKLQRREAVYLIYWYVSANLMGLGQSYVSV